MNWKKITSGVNSAVLTLLILGIILAVNVISLFNFQRWDLTERGLYTISDVTIDTISSLDDQVFIRCFFSGQLPPFLHSLKQEILDLLEEYRTYAGGKISIEILDPTGNLDLQQRSKAMGIPIAQFNVIEENQVQVLNAYFGMSIEYEDKKTVIPFITTTTTLEYDLTSAIRKVTNPQLRTIAFMTGHGERSIYKDLKAVTAELLKHYKIMEVDTRAGEAILDEVDSLVIARPKEITERDKYEIDQFLMRGGKLLFLIDCIEFTGASLDTRLIRNSIYDLLEHYGVEIPYDVVLDPDFHAPASFQTDLTRFRINYPFWPMVINAHMDRNNPVTSRLESIVFPWTSPVILLPAHHQPEVTYTSLAYTGPDAWTEGGSGNNLKPRKSYPKPALPSPETFTLAGLLSGRFTSFYADKLIPIPEEQYRDENYVQKKIPETIPLSPPTQIVVVGSSRFLINHYISLFPSNGLFFLNLINWLNSGEDLIRIRSRHNFDRPLDKITESKKNFLKYMNIFSASLFIMLFGMIRWLLRRRAKQKYEVRI